MREIEKDLRVEDIKPYLKTGEANPLRILADKFGPEPVIELSKLCGGERPYIQTIDTLLRPPRLRAYPEK